TWRRAGAWRERGYPRISNKIGRHTDRPLALRSALGGGRGRSALERGLRERSEISRLGARARSTRRGQASRKTRAQAPARRAADRALGHRHRELAARPLYDIRQ